MGLEPLPRWICGVPRPFDGGDVGAPLTNGSRWPVPISRFSTGADVMSGAGPAQAGAGCAAGSRRAVVGGPAPPPTGSPPHIEDQTALRKIANGRGKIQRVELAIGFENDLIWNQTVGKIESFPVAMNPFGTEFA